MEQAHRSIRGVQVFVNTHLLREFARHVTEYQSSEIPDTTQLRYLRMRGSDTSIVSGTALLHPAVYLLSFEHEKTFQMADLLGIAHDSDDQFTTIFYFCQQNVLLGGSAVRPTNLLVIFKMKMYKIKRFISMRCRVFSRTLVQFIKIKKLK
jgi:hypothetical protein